MYSLDDFDLLNSRVGGSPQASVTVSNAEFVVEATSRFLGWADVNQHKKVSIAYRLFDHRISPL